MNPVSTLLGKAWPYIVAALLVGVITLQQREIGGLHEVLGRERAARAVTLDANQTQRETITRLQRSVEEWMAAASVAADVRAQAAQAADYRAQLDKLSAEVKEVKAHETPDCQALLAVDLGARCVVLTGRLRELAADR